MKNLLANWKTTSTGVLMIVGALVHLVFSIKSGNASEGVWTATITAVLGGVGLLMAGDGSKSQDAHEETKQLVSNLQAQITTTAQAVVTGDTSIIQRQPPVVPPLTPANSAATLNKP